MTSKLLQSGRGASAAEWRVELESWKAKLAALEKDLAAKQAEANDPTRDPWFGEVMLGPQIKMTEDAVKVARHTVAELERRHEEAKKTRPQALKEREAAYAERDALGDEIAKRFPAIVTELADLLKRAAASEDRIRKVALAGEGEIDSTSPWDRARGNPRPLVIFGRKAAPRVALETLEGKEVWPVAEDRIDAMQLPPMVNVRNVSDRPALASTADGKTVTLEAGEALEDVPAGAWATNGAEVEIAIR